MAQSTHTTQRTIVGSFPDYAQAQRCIGALEQAGFGESEVGVLRKDENAGKEHSQHAHPAVSAGTGAVEGGLLGAAAAFLIPGAGPVIGAGILGMTLLGALTGAATGGAAGAFTHAGLGKDESEHFGKEVDKGHTVVTVRSTGREDEAHQIMRHYGAAEMTERAAAAGEDQRDVNNAEHTGEYTAPQGEAMGGRAEERRA